MSHLSENGMTYFSHLLRAWKWAFMLIVHGLFPNVWETKVSEQICSGNKINRSRSYMLKKMFNIEEK